MQYRERVQELTVAKNKLQDMDRELQIRQNDAITIEVLFLVLIF